MEIDAQELKLRMERGDELLIIDVREAHEVAVFAIDSVHIPLGTLPMRLYDFDDNPDQEIVVVCHSGMRSAAAQAILQQSGFTKVYNLRGGMMGWRNHFGV